VPLVVLPGPPVSLVLEPESDSIPAGAATPFLAVLKDQFGNVIPEEDAPLVWEATAGGRVTSNGFFVAGLKTGDFPDAVRVSLPPGSMGNTATFRATASVTVRQRSADMLAVELGDQDGGGIALVDLATAELRPLARSLSGNGASEFSPQWTPDGSRVLYVGEHAGTFQVFDADPVSGRVRRLTDDPEGAVLPAVSPDGTKLLYATVTGEEWELYVLDISLFSSGAEAAPIPRSAGSRIFRASDIRQVTARWSPDGLKIACTVVREDGTLAIEIVYADGSGAMTLTGQGSEVFFDWSSDGSRILAGRDRGDGGGELVTIDLATGQRRLIKLPFSVLLAAWAPDNSELAVVDSEIGAMWLVDADSTSLRQSFTADADPRRVSWRPVALKTQ
jgi:dipeptidyl aminopeptidase/acylaminoacyl peptidase